MRHVDFDEALYRRLVEVDIARIRFGNRYFRDDFEERRFGGAVALRNVTRSDNGLFNRVVGLGADELAALDEIVAFYAQANIPCQIDICPISATPELLVKLQESGFRHSGTCSVFRGVPERVQSAADGIRIEEASGDSVVEWIDLHRSLGEKPALDPAERDARAAFLAEHPEYRLFFACVGDERVAVAALLIHGTACHLANACTDQGKRGLGCQRALLLHRVDVAAQTGCTLAVTDTMFGATSHRNVERVGFRLAYNPTFWVRTKR